MVNDQAGPHGFLIGGRYRNRQNEYEVIDFNGDRLRVMYDDGTEAFLTAATRPASFGTWSRKLPNSNHIKDPGQETATRVTSEP